jgi:cysteine-rich repeat protein
VHEACDDGNIQAGDGCRADCLGTEDCGDGYLDPIQGESCDDGNLWAWDGCDDACQPEALVLDPASGLQVLAGWKVTRHAVTNPLAFATAYASGPTFGDQLYSLSLTGRFVAIEPDGTQSPWFDLVASTPSSCGRSEAAGGPVGIVAIPGGPFGEGIYTGTVNNTNPCEVVSFSDPDGNDSIHAVGDPATVPVSAVWGIEVAAGGAFGDWLYLGLGSDLARVDPAGLLELFVPGLGARGLALGGGGAYGQALYAALQQDGRIDRVWPDGSTSAFADAGLDAPRDLQWGRGGLLGEGLIVSDLGAPNGVASMTIKRISPDGRSVTVLAQGLDATDPGVGSISTTGTRYCHGLFVTDFDNAGTPQSEIVEVRPPSLNCGDGSLDACEECDDGNRMAGDGCDEGCWSE